MNQKFQNMFITEFLQEMNIVVPFDVGPDNIWKQFGFVPTQIVIFWEVSS